MQFRLLALMMALLIGVPSCWCAVMVPAMQTTEVETAAPSCARCAGQSELPSDHSDSHSSTEQCPCAKGLSIRDFAPQLATAPRPVLVDFETSVWERAEGNFHQGMELPALVSVVKTTDHAARSSAAIYIQHCSLLI